MTIWTLAFWRAAAERSIKTFAQAAAALLLASGVGLLDTAWTDVLSVAGMAAVVSLLTSIGSDVLTGTGPSLTDAEVVTTALAPRSSAPPERGAHAAERSLLVAAVLLFILALAAVVLRISGALPQIGV